MGNDISRWSGFYHDFMGTVENSGLVQFAEKVVDEHGFYTAKVTMDGIKKMRTFFPQHWTPEKVISKILEAYDHFTNNGSKNYEQLPNGTYLVTGLIEEGIELEIHITKEGQMTFIYPLLYKGS